MKRCQSNFQEGESNIEFWIPYTYLLVHLPTGKKYYGVRYAVGCNPTDFWKTYTTSSKYVKELINQYGKESFVYSIRKTFNSPEKARLWEHKVLKRLKVVDRSDFLNKTDNKSIAPMYGNANPATRDDIKEKIRASVLKWCNNNTNPSLGKKWSEERKIAWSNARTGEFNPFYNKKHTAENIKRFSEMKKGIKHPNYGKPISDTLKARLSEVHTGVPKARVCCIYCKKEISINSFPRWHGKNCKWNVE